MATIELVERATRHGSSEAIVSEGKSYTYEELLVSSANVAAGLLGGQQDLEIARIGFLVPRVLPMRPANGVSGEPVVLPFRWDCNIRCRSCNT